MSTPLRRAPLLALALAACPEPPPPPECPEPARCDTDPPPTDPPPKPARVPCALKDVWPVRERAPIYPRSHFVATFTADAREGATFSFTPGGVTAGTVTWSDDGTEAVFRPASPLAPATEHEIHVSAACLDASVVAPFVTSDVGAAIPADDVLGGSFVATLSELHVIQPAEVRELFGGLVSQIRHRLVLVPSAHDTDTQGLDFFAAAADTDLRQDLCEPTIAIPAPTAFAPNPFFELEGVPSVDVPLEGTTIRLDDVSMSGAFTPDAQSIAGLSIAGRLDVAQLDTILAPLTEEPQPPCDLVSTLTAGAVSCGPCPNGRQTCVELATTGLTATRAEATFVPRDSDSLHADTDCR